MRTNEACKRSEVSNAMEAIACEMQGIVFEAAEPVRAGETVKRQMRRAYERLISVTGLIPLREWRVISAWKGEAGCWGGVAVKDFERRRDELRAKRARIEEAGRATAADLGIVYWSAAQRLRAIDEDFHRGEITRLERAACDLGYSDRAGAQAIVLPAPDQDERKRK